MNRDEQLDIINNVWPLISDQDVAALEERLVDMPHLAGASAQCPQVLTHSARPMASACIAQLACGTRVFIKRYAPHLISEYDLCVKHDYVNRRLPDAALLRLRYRQNMSDDGRMGLGSERMCAG